MILFLILAMLVLMFFAPIIASVGISLLALAVKLLEELGKTIVTAAPYVKMGWQKLDVLIGRWLKLKVSR